MFEWDDAKQQQNIKKHKISFNEAKSVFYDDHGLIIPDPLSSNGEERALLLGQSEQNNLLIVCHCEYLFNHIRIISARPATAHEKKHYERGYHA